MKFLYFILIFVGHFCPPGSGSGSKTLLCTIPTGHLSVSRGVQVKDEERMDLDLNAESLNRELAELGAEATSWEAEARRVLFEGKQQQQQHSQQQQQNQHPQQQLHQHQHAGRNGLIVPAQAAAGWGFFQAGEAVAPFRDLGSQSTSLMDYQLAMRGGSAAAATPVAHCFGESQPPSLLAAAGMAAIPGLIRTSGDWDMSAMMNWRSEYWDQQQHQQQQQQQQQQLPQVDEVKREQLGEDKRSAAEERRSQGENFGRVSVIQGEIEGEGRKKPRQEQIVLTEETVVFVK
jgi:hypothetical protein